jgi:hypothetical protein
MTLTIDRTDLRSPSMERWLEVMYGIRPNAAVRRTFVPMSYQHDAGVVDWLRTMWGVTAEDQRPAS